MDKRKKGGIFLKKGKRLQLGDTIGITAPASPTKIELVLKAVKSVKALGFRVRLGETCLLNDGGYVAGKPEDRAEELTNMFEDPEIDAIMCMRGGYGSPQILDALDYDRIVHHPKLFIGYSDITALHIAFLQRANLATVHGPMAASELSKDMSAYTINSLLKTIMTSAPIGKLMNPIGEDIICLVEGEACGEIVGGNLCLISDLMGTPFELDTRGKLLFLEDIGEEPYRIDRMLTQLALAGKFADAAGIILGTWTDCKSRLYPAGSGVLQVCKNIIVPFQKPTIYNLQAGHCSSPLSLPLGVNATLYAQRKELIIEESVVEG